MATTRTWSVPGVSCGHCKSSIEGAVSKLAGVDQVEVDIDAKTVRVEGDTAEEEIFSAIDEAGYEVAGAVS